jgi:hypothetical protein
MRLINHYLHVYQKPKQGTNFLQRYLAYNYQHTIVNQGWYDTASCDIAVRSDAEGQKILNQFLGNFVSVFVDNPVNPIWEGLINRITFNSGGASYTISLDEMANSVNVAYTAASNTGSLTATANNFVSQAIYGIKQDQIEFGPDPSASTAKTLLRDTILAQRAFPQAAVSKSQGNTNIVHLELIGIFHTLEWSKQFTGSSTATLAADAAIAAYVANNANLATFFDSTSVAKISANAATVPIQVRGISFWERLLNIAETGDGTNYWVCGILPTDRTTGKRLFYYKLANTAVEYTAFKSDGLKPRNVFGRVIQPWLVVPDRAIRVNDALVGFYSGSIQNDPTATYIQSIQYDANSQTVNWFGADNTTARATFMLNRGYLPLGREFGAPLRQVTT